MKPKKVKDLIPKISKELQLSEEEVKSVIDIYWDKVRKALSSLEYEHVNVPGLGVFGVKPWMVEKKLRINNHLIEKYINTPTVGSLTIINNLSKDNIKLNSTKERLEVLKQKKEKIKHERRNQNLEGEEQDS